MNAPLGYIHDPFDPRDARLSFFKREWRPEKYSLDDVADEEVDQRNIGSCVANAGFDAIRIKQVLQYGDEHGLPPQAARLWGYYLSRAAHNMQDHDSGTHIRTFFKMMNKLGFMPEDQYEHGYDTSEYATKPTPAMNRLAHDQRTPDNSLIRYERVYETGAERVEAVKQSVYNGNPVVFGTDVSVPFTQGAYKGKVAEPPVPGEPIAGGHAMTIVGYGPGYFELRNWWRGHHRLHVSENYIAWPGSRDFWSVLRVPKYIGRWPE